MQNETTRAQTVRLARPVGQKTMVRYNVSVCLNSRGLKASINAQAEFLRTHPGESLYMKESSYLMSLSHGADTLPVLPEQDDKMVIMELLVNYGSVEANPPSMYPAVLDEQGNYTLRGIASMMDADELDGMCKYAAEIPDGGTRKFQEVARRLHLVMEAAVFPVVECWKYLMLSDTGGVPHATSGVRRGDCINFEDSQHMGTCSTRHPTLCCDRLADTSPIRFILVRKKGGRRTAFMDTGLIGLVAGMNTTSQHLAKRRKFKSETVSHPAPVTASSDDDAFGLHATATYRTGTVVHAGEALIVLVSPPPS